MWTGLVRELLECVSNTVDVRGDEAGVVEEHAQARHLGRVVPDRLLRAEEILSILPAARVRAVRGREDGERPPHAVVAHLPHRVGEERMPVAVAEVYRQVDPTGVQLGLERRDQRAVLLVERTDAGEELVVVRDLEQTLARDAASSRHVLEERKHVVHALGPAERDEQDRVERLLRQGRNRPVGRLLPLVDRRRHGRMVPGATAQPRVSVRARQPRWRRPQA